MSKRKGAPSLLEKPSKMAKNEVPPSGHDQFGLQCENFHDDILNTLLQLEITIPEGWVEMQRMQIQFSHIQQLVEWMILVCKDLKQNEKTMMLAVKYLRCFLSRRELENPSYNFQLLGITCIFIASKINESPEYRIPAQLSSIMTGDTYTINEIEKMERTIVTTLEFDLFVSTIYDFFPFFRKYVGIPTSNYDFAANNEVCSCCIKLSIVILLLPHLKNDAIPTTVPRY
eukprot:TRINITY_DN3753_c0_g1_i3.p1 TRINITY_DN3753_c0_g1~~TRINITY_DN3753_c0_g1_i3.p1  ORF type:complete len:229 (-),score=36.09 TRINITY_DN3753_c0_g1_i3:268-954(-)